MAEGTITIDVTKAETIGDNLKAITINGYVIFIAKANQSIGPSKSGKMDGIASTGGFAKIAGGMSVNLYLGKKS